MTVDRWGTRSLDRHGVIDSERYLADLRKPVGLISAVTRPLNYVSRSTTMYSMNEAFARERMRMQLEQSARRRLADGMASARLWQRLAAYSERRAARSSRRLAEQSAADYQLVG